jgi:NAD(P) transhydrogenase subunit alpha
VIVGCVKETFPGERRAAVAPNVVGMYTKRGCSVLVEQDLGESAGFPDSAYTGQGAEIAPQRADVFARADVIAQVRGLGANPELGSADLGLLRADQVLVATFEPLTALDEVRRVAKTGATLFALELVPRITRAQTMDVLSSMATIAGYKAVLLAAENLPKMFPLTMTAAGTVKAARVLVIGAGVAGLQAIASARRLGALVEAYDIRPAVKEQVLSLGAKFVELDLQAGGAEDKGGYAKAMGEDFYRRQRELMKNVVANVDVVITTAAVPGKKAPILVTAEMVQAMRPGSVIVDIAAERGGNCELVRPGDTVVEHGVTIVGPLNLPATVPFDASQMFARNVAAFVLNMVNDGALAISNDDEIVAGSRVTQGGEVVHPLVREAMGLPPQAPAAASASTSARA